jgi:hypothetical protein
MSVGSTSFFSQDQNWFQANSASTNAATATSLFNTPSSQANNTTSTVGGATPNGSSSGISSSESAMLGTFGTIQMNASTGEAVIAAQEAANRSTATQNVSTQDGQPTKSVADVATQVSVTGSLSSFANFGSVGPSSSGGYEFLNGSALQTAFTNALTGVTSDGEPVDTVTVIGNTLSAETSGTNAHVVFQLTLKPQSGSYTFTLDQPIDQKKTLLPEQQTIDLSSLVQAVSNNGTTQALPNSLVINVANKLGDSTPTANGGTIHEGGLAYTGPNNTTTTTTSKTPAKPTPYTAPTNPLTGRGYSDAAGAATATFGATSLLLV